MPDSLIPQTPEPHTTSVLPFGQPSSRAVARSTRRQVDMVLARAEVAHTKDQVRAVLASGALNNVTALVALAEQCYESAPAGAPYYEAIIKAYSLSAARTITNL